MKITNIDNFDITYTKIGLIALYSVTLNYRLKRHFIVLDGKILFTYIYFKPAYDKYIKLWRENIE